MITKSYLKTLKQSELAAILDKTERRIQQLHDEGLPRNGSGRGTTYDWMTVKGWFEGRISGKGEITDKGRREKAEADLAEMKRDLEAGRLMVADEARAVWTDECARMRSRLLAMPAKLAVQIEEGQTIAQREALVRDEIHQALQELADAEETPDA